MLSCSPRKFSVSQFGCVDQLARKIRRCASVSVWPTTFEILTPTAPSICPTALIISQFIAVTSPRISITTGSFSNWGRARWACIRHTAKWEGETCDYPRHHSIALMCDDIDTTVGGGAKGALLLIVRGPWNDSH